MQYQITTSRLLIEPLQLSDNNFILELVNTKGWLDFIGDRNLHSQEDVTAYIDKINNNQNVKYWVVKLNDTNTSIGIITLIKRNYLQHHDIGFAFLPNYFGKGFAYEATKAVLQNIAHQHTHFLAITISANTNSINLLKKMGLIFDKSIVENGEELQIWRMRVENIYTLS